MKKYIKNILMIALLAVFVISSGIVFNKHMDYHKGEVAQDYAIELAETPIPTTDGAEIVASMEEEFLEDDQYSLELKRINLEALREVNGDVVGWIMIPDTIISYPLMQGEDNDYYLHHSWDMEKNSAGSIYLDYRTDSALGDFNTIIYGHHMRSGDMFSQLHMFKEEGFFENHPGIYIMTDQGIFKYALYARYETVTDATYVLEFANDEEKEMFIDVALEQYGKEPKVLAGTEDKFLTLSTCTGQGHHKRWIVQGVLEGVIKSDN